MNVIATTMLVLFYLISPAKEFVKPGEPVEIRFAQAPNEAATKLVAAVGLKAIDVPGTFSPTEAKDLFDAAGKPLFHLYSFDGKEIAPTDIKSPSLNAGKLDITPFYPQIQKVGTYIFTYKTAQPLVISTLANPGFYAKNDPVITHISPLVTALITTDKGDIKLTFAYNVAPHTIENFIQLAQGGFYDNLCFHRIMKGFMIQGGDPLGKTEDRAGSGSPGYSIVQEFSDKNHARGVISMARAQDPDSAGSQFFIMHAEKAFLNGQYTAFGQVIEGLDVVDKIADTPNSGENGAVKVADRPIIKSIRILPATPEQYGIK